LFSYIKKIIYQLDFCLNTFDKLSEKSRKIYYDILKNLVNHEIEILIYLEYCFLDEMANNKHDFEQYDCNKMIDQNETKIFQIYKQVVNYNTSDMLKELQSELIDMIDMSVFIPELERKLESGDLIEADFFIFNEDD